jgi:RHS repeat-associated protein
MLLADLPNPAQRTTRYFYGGESQWQVCEEQDGSGDTVATYVYGRYIDEVLQMQRCESTPSCTSPGGTGVSPVDDDLYNVMAVTDDAGNVVERYEYDDYGRPTFMNANGDVLAQPPGNREPSWIANPYLFTGRRFDPETAWYHYRTRYLDPAAGRFTTRDVIGIWGDPWEFGNGYVYVGNSPLFWLDPFGLCSQKLQDLIDRLRTLADSLDEAEKSKNQALKDAHDWLRQMREVLERVKTPPSWLESQLKKCRDWKSQVAKRGFWMLFEWGPPWRTMTPPLIDIKPECRIEWRPDQNKLREAERQIEIAKQLIRDAGEAYSNAIGSAARAHDELNDAITRCEEEDRAQPNEGGGDCGGDPP